MATFFVFVVISNLAYSQVSVCRTIGPLVLSPFLKGFPFKLSNDASHTPSFIYIISGLRF